MLKEPRIIDRGRGPEIEGTRITVYDIMDYYKHGEHHTYIATALGIGSAQVLCAIRYIEAHEDEVMADYQRILQRHARGNPPEIQKKLDEAHEKFMRKVEGYRRLQRKESAGAGIDA